MLTPPWPAKKSLIGDESSAPPGTLTWYRPRDGEKMPTYTCAVPSVAPGAPLTMATSLTMTSLPRRADPMP